MAKISIQDVEVLGVVVLGGALLYALYKGVSAAGGAISSVASSISNTVSSTVADVQAIQDEDAANAAFDAKYGGAGYKLSYPTPGQTIAATQNMIDAAAAKALADQAAADAVHEGSYSP